MVVPKGRGLIAKRSATEDFSVIQTADRGSAEVEQHVRTLLQIHQQSETTSSEFFFKRSGERWLVGAANEGGTDAAGRRRFRAEFERVGHAIHLTSFGALMAGVDSTKPAFAGTLSPGGHLALAGLIFGRTIVAVSDQTDAILLLSQWGEDPALTIMSTNGRVPWDYKAGRLLVIAPEKWKCLAAVHDLDALIGNRTIPDIPGLRGIPAERRERLIRCWANGDTDYASLQDDEATWLLNGGGDRESLLSQSPAALLRKWLREGRLTSGEIIRRKEAWEPSDADALVPQLANAPGGLDCFIECTRPAPENLRTFLKCGDAARVEAYDWVLNGCKPGTNVSGDKVTELAVAGALETIDLTTVSRLARALPEAIIVEMWIRMGGRAGVPRSVMESLIKGTVPDLAPGWDFDKAPDCEWLIAVPETNMKMAAGWMSRTRVGRALWRRSIGRDLPGAEYSPEGGEWVVSGIRLGQLTAQFALGTWARWRQADVPVPSEVGRKILEASGLSPADQLVAYIEGRRSLSESVGLGMLGKEIPLLIEAGLIGRETVAREIEQGAPVALLRNLVNPAAYALLALDASPPQVPPVDWPAWATDVLARSVAQKRFWMRWEPQGIPQELVDWLADKLRSFGSGTMVADIAAAVRGEGKLFLADLEIAGSALGPIARLQQAVEWAGSSDQDAVFRALAGGQATSALLWLRQRTREWGFPATPRDLTVREIGVLMPWLNWQWIVRTVMSRDVRDKDEDRLLSKLHDLLLGSDEKPLAAPPPEIVARRPEWVRRLSSLSGWEAWDKALKDAEAR